MSRISDQSRVLCDATGYDELSLCSLSSSDYTHIRELLNMLLDWAEPRKINIALPSLRIDNFDRELLERLSSVRKSGLTFAPEAGTQRLRDVINKNITEEEILNTSREAFAGGRTAVKLYFMIGLPTETDEDVKGVAEHGVVLSECEAIPVRERAGEYLMLRLRTTHGIEKEEYEKTFLLPFAPLEKLFAKYEKAELAEKTEAGRLRLTPKGFLVSNSIIVELLEAQQHTTPLAKKR